LPGAPFYAFGFENAVVIFNNGKIFKILPGLTSHFTFATIPLKIATYLVDIYKKKLYLCLRYYIRQFLKIALTSLPHLTRQSALSFSQKESAGEVANPIRITLKITFNIDQDVPLHFFVPDPEK